MSRHRATDANPSGTSASTNPKSRKNPFGRFSMVPDHKDKNGGRYWNIHIKDEHGNVIHRGNGPLSEEKALEQIQLMQERRKKMQEEAEMAQLHQQMEQRKQAGGDTGAQAPEHLAFGKTGSVYLGPAAQSRDSREASRPSSGPAKPRQNSTFDDTDGVSARDRHFSTHPNPTGLYLSDSDRRGAYEHGHSSTPRNSRGRYASRGSDDTRDSSRRYPPDAFRRHCPPNFDQDMPRGSRGRSDTRSGGTDTNTHHRTTSAGGRAFSLNRSTSGGLIPDHYRSAFEISSGPQRPALYRTVSAGRSAGCHDCGRTSHHTCYTDPHFQPEGVHYVYPQNSSHTFGHRTDTRPRHDSNNHRPTRRSSLSRTTRTDPQSDPLKISAKLRRGSNGWTTKIKFN